MRKIPTLFLRDESDRRFVTRVVHPACQWVLDGEGVATRKLDGTCMMFDGAAWWARREVKAVRTPPSGWVELERDAVTARAVGWEPAGQSPFAAMWAEAVAAGPAHGQFAPGTYELCGPKINRNPERHVTHVLLAHADAEVVEELAGARDPEAVAALVCRLGTLGWEGLVWHNPDGRRAKLKARDFAAVP
jgi:hypothetical protein